MAVTFVVGAGAEWFCFLFLFKAVLLFFFCLKLFCFFFWGCELAGLDRKVLCWVAWSKRKNPNYEHSTFGFRFCSIIKKKTDLIFVKKT